MNEYRKAVEYYASNRIDYLFHNKGNDHAKIIFENIFRNAHDHIRISALNLWNSEVVRTEEYTKALTYYINQPNSRLDILVKEFPEKEDLINQAQYNIYRLLHCHPAYAEGRITIKTGNGKSFKNPSGDEVHFCTADGHMYRFEDNITERTAQCNFNDSKTSENFEALFDNAFNNSATVVNLNDIFA